MVEKRYRMGPIPADPQNHITEQQVNGLLILKKFGWKLVCIRRAHDTSGASTTILHNRQDGSVGILEPNGVLTISKTLQIRKRRERVEVLERNTKRLIERMNQPAFSHSFL